MDQARLAGKVVALARLRGRRIPGVIEVNDLFTLDEDILALAPRGEQPPDLAPVELPLDALRLVQSRRRQFRVVNRPMFQRHGDSFGTFGWRNPTAPLHPKSSRERRVSRRRTAAPAAAAGFPA